MSLSSNNGSSRKESAASSWLDGGREGAYGACLEQNPWVLEHHMTTHPPAVGQREEEMKETEDKNQLVEGGGGATSPCR